jgi:excisionase family DNA binding protein
MGPPMMVSSPEDEGLRTLKAGAKFLGVSESTVYRLGIKGELELIKVGGRTCVTQSSLSRYIKNAKRVIPNRK